LNTKNKDPEESKPVGAPRREASHVPVHRAGQRNAGWAQRAEDGLWCLCPEVGPLLPSQGATNAATGFEKGKTITMNRTGVAGQ